MRRLTLALAPLLVACASYSAPATQSPQAQPASIPISPDTAWRRTLDYLGSAGIPVSSSDRAGGVISAKPAMTLENVRRWVDCGTVSGKPAVDSRQMAGVVVVGDLSITVQPSGTGSNVRPALGVTATWDRPVYGGTSSVSCVSSGALERELVEYVRSRAR